MRKRILSLLLMAVLLVTSIPVLAVSATDGETVNTTEYYKWYVGADEGPTPTDAKVTLVGNFTAFANEDNSNGAIYATTKTSSNQKWYNKVEGGAAISMYNAATTWKCAENAAANGGGLSPRLTRGNYTSGTDKATRMELLNAWMKDIANVFVETSSVYYGMTGSSTSASDTAEHFRFEVLRGTVWPQTCDTSSMRLVSVWRAKQSIWHDTNGRNSHLSTVCGGVSTFSPAGLTLYLQKSTVQEEETTYISYAVGYNTGDGKVSFADNTNKRIEKSAHDKLYSDINAASSRDSRLTLYQRTPFDVYTVRVYHNGTLTQAEREYNHFIDLLGFYQVAIPDSARASMLMNIAPQFASTIFIYEDAPASGQQGYSAIKASLEAALGYGPTEYYKWYVGAENGPAPTDANVDLVGNFTAFAGDVGAYDNTLSNGNDKWFNRGSAGAAGNITMYSNVGNWSPSKDANANGGGLNAGIYTRSNYANAAATGVRMELLASWANAEQALVETSYVYVGAETGSTVSESDTAETFRFGVLRGHILPIFSYTTSMRLVEYWRAQQSSWNDPYARNKNIYNVCGGTANFKPAGLTLYMQKTTTVEEGSKYISYAIGYNNGLDKNLADQSDTGVSYADRTSDRIEYNAHETLYGKINTAASRSTRFVLYQRSTADVYTIRVYNGGLLTQAEKEYNHLIDLLGFYQVKVPFGMKAEGLMPIASEFMDTIFTYGEEFAANQADLKAAVDVAASLTISDTAETRVAEDFAGVRFRATISKAVADAYSVKAYGILIAPKAYVEAAGAFTTEALEAYVASWGVAEERAYLRTEVTEFYAVSDTAYTIAGGFADFSSKTQEVNPEFLAIAYAVVNIGGKDVLLYGNGTTCIKVKETMVAAREKLYNENATDPRLKIYDNVIAGFTK